jgi:hypothetical protein
MAEALRSLGDHPVRRARAATTARAIAEARFDERDVVARVLDTYRDVAADQGLRVVGLNT